eukprot:4384891-Prymnesium_polylepis.1
MARLVRCVSVTDANLQGNQDSYLLGPLFLTISRNPSIRTLSTHWPDERFRRETEQLTLVEAGRLPRLRNIDVTPFSDCGLTIYKGLSCCALAIAASQVSRLTSHVSGLTSQVSGLRSL